MILKCCQFGGGWWWWGRVHIHTWPSPKRSPRVLCYWRRSPVPDCWSSGPRPPHRVWWWKPGPPRYWRRSEWSPESRRQRCPPVCPGSGCPSWQPRRWGCRPPAAGWSSSASSAASLRGRRSKSSAPWSGPCSGPACPARRPPARRTRSWWPAGSSSGSPAPSPCTCSSSSPARSSPPPPCAPWTPWRLWSWSRCVRWSHWFSPCLSVGSSVEVCVGVCGVKRLRPASPWRWNCCCCCSVKPLTFVAHALWLCALRGRCSGGWRQQPIGTQGRHTRL